MSIIKSTGGFRGQEIIDKTRKHLEPEELEKFFAALKERSTYWYTYFRLQYYFGCRVSEVALLLKEDIELSKKQIIVRRLKKKQFRSKQVEEDGKLVRRQDKSDKISDGYKESVYALTDKLVVMLKAHMKTLDREAKWCFPSPTRSKTCAAKDRMAEIRRLDDGSRAISRSSADNYFRDTARSVGIPKHLCKTHVLRHTRATLMLASGASENDVCFLLGHESIATTRRYIGVARQLRQRMETSAIMGDLADGG